MAWYQKQYQLKKKRRRNRREVRDILEALGNDNEAIGEDDSQHSDSINSDDILRRNAAIIKAFEQAISDSKKLGVIHLESDEEVMQRLVKFNLGDLRNFQQQFVSTS